MPIEDTNDIYDCTKSILGSFLPIMLCCIETIFEYIT